MSSSVISRWEKEHDSKQKAQVWRNSFHECRIARNQLKKDDFNHPESSLSDETSRTPLGNPMCPTEPPEKFRGRIRMDFEGLAKSHPLHRGGGF